MSFDPFNPKSTGAIHEGIVATTKDNKIIFLKGMVQSELEQVMAELGYGASEYWLSFGKLQEFIPF